MASKHYDISYLQNTRRLLGALKEHSYTFFKEIKTGMIVDLGCGAGIDALELAKLAGKDVEVIGLDHDPRMIDQAQDIADQIENVKFFVSEAHQLPFDSNSIAGLRTERVIQHLHTPETVVREMHRVLKPDSPLVIVETDWFSLTFYTQFVDVQKKITSYLTDVKVNNGYAARKLTSYLEESHFSRIHLEIHPFVIRSLSDANEYFWIGKIVNEAFDKGYITLSEQENFLNRFSR